LQPDGNPLNFAEPTRAVHAFMPSACSEDSAFDLDGWVLNTEAHPLRVARGKSQHAQQQEGQQQEQQRKRWWWPPARSKASGGSSASGDGELLHDLAVT
jgi:hypothetical protein